MTATPSLGTLLAQMSALTAALPTRLATTLRAGPGVVDELKHHTAPSPLPGMAPLLPGVPVIEDTDYPIGVWRVFDQYGEEMHAGVMLIPGATLRVELSDGTGKTMRVMTITRGSDGRITEYTVADPALLDGMPWAARWFGAAQ